MSTKIILISILVSGLVHGIETAFASSTIVSKPSYAAYFMITKYEAK